MAKTPEELNKGYGVSLAVRIMDTVRLKSEAGENITMWSVCKHLADADGITGTKRDRLYERVRRTIVKLANGGQLKAERVIDPNKEQFIKRITLCSKS